MKKIPATVMVLTHNSASTLVRALSSVKDFGELLVVDGGSTDETLSIAEAAGATILRQPPPFLKDGKIIDFAGVRNFGLKHAKYDWVLWLDSDEAASSGLVTEIKETLEQDCPPGAFKIPAGIVLDGRNIKYSSNYPGYQVRFFHRAAGTFKKPIHERFVVSEQYPLREFAHPWHYFTESETQLREFNRDVDRDLPLYRARYRDLSFASKVYGVYRSLRIIVGIVAKTLLNLILHPFDEGRFPLWYEWLRTQYQVSVIFAILTSNKS